MTVVSHWFSSSSEPLLLADLLESLVAGSSGVGGGSSSSSANSSNWPQPPTASTVLSVSFWCWFRMVFVSSTLRNLTPSSSPHITVSKSGLSRLWWTNLFPPLLSFMTAVALSLTSNIPSFQYTGPSYLAVNFLLFSCGMTLKSSKTLSPTLKFKSFARLSYWFFILIRFSFKFSFTSWNAVCIVFIRWLL